MTEFTKNGITLVFYQKPGDQKFSFLIKDNEELTERLLLSVSTKRIREDKIKYAVKGIFEKIENNLLTNLNKKTMKNPIVELSEKIQKNFGKSILTRVVGKKGEDHNPTITVEIELPNGKIFQSSGLNQKTAKQKAAEKALEEL